MDEGVGESVGIQKPYLIPKPDVTQRTSQVSANR